MIYKFKKNSCTILKQLNKSSQFKSYISYTPFSYCDVDHDHP